MRILIFIFAFVFSFAALAVPTRFKIHNTRNGLDFEVQMPTASPPPMQPEWGSSPTIATEDMATEVQTKALDDAEYRAAIEALKKLKGKDMSSSEIKDAFQLVIKALIK